MKNTKKVLTKLVGLTLALTMVAAWGACSASYVPNYNYAAMGDAVIPPKDANGEEYTEIVENPFIDADKINESYFSIDANTASYPNLRSLLRNGYSIPKDAVRVEEMLNYFNYDYKTPTDGGIFSLTSSVFDTPYNEDTKLLTIGLAATEIEFSEVRNNIVFLIDKSGSMASDDKLPLIQQAFSMLAENLNPEDRVSVVTYAAGSDVELDGAYGYQTNLIKGVIEDMVASGSTAGSNGIQTAYRIAEKYFIEGGNNRVVLATDGDFNVGITGDNALKRFIANKRDTGVYFSVIGVGRENTKAQKMESLALNGNGTYSYIDSVAEARRALVEQIGGSIVTVAKNVKAGVEFNTKYIDSYRLIGYENKLLTEEQFDNEDKDAGDLGSGHTVTIVYELTLTDEPFSSDDNLAQVKIRYKETAASGVDEESDEALLEIKTDDYHQQLTDTDAFVAGVIEFALILRNSIYKADADLSDLVDRLQDLELSDDEAKEEFRGLVNLYYEQTKRMNGVTEDEDYY